MDPNFIFVDEYVQFTGSRCDERGEVLQGIVDDYIAVLKSIRSDSIMSGKLAEALSVYISCAEALKGQITDFSNNAKRVTGAFVEEIDAADSYIF